MNKYVDLFVSAIAFGLAAGCAVYTTGSLTPAIVAGVGAFATSIIQQQRQWPREVWTDEKRKEQA